MSAHTPGPWEAADFESASCATCFIPVFVGDRYIAQANLKRNVSHDECEANARLIAASPDLLRVSELALSMILEECADAEHTDQVFQLRNAIAKAKGQE